jgi:SAM-dependent methyltransferase
MTVDPVRARVFGQVAREYERIRPGYPADLVTEVLAYAPPGPVLEIGAGTGKATAAFTARGALVTALEPDRQMLDVLRAKLPGVPAVPETFEEHTPAQPYALLYSAQAWHWTDPATRWPRAAAALAPAGALALFWNGDQFTDPAARDTFVAVHQRLAPQVDLHSGPPVEDDPVTDQPWQELIGRAEFTDFQRRFYNWRRELSVQDFLALLSTMSAYRILDAGLRDELFTALRGELPAQLTLTMGTVLYLARRA